MTLRLYDTLTRSSRSLTPLEEGKVRMYACGPTVYDTPHIGNFRAFVFVDLLRRYLEFLGYEVDLVMNVTDVDDRIIQRCREENLSRSTLTEKFKTLFFEDAGTLGILPARAYPEATNHIREMQALVNVLVEKGRAYSTRDGSVFFKVASFPEYGSLSRVDMANLSQTERVSSDHYDKESIRDFALWKGHKEEDGSIWWDSPWGKGRPGWHIECSAMSMKYLGEEFDIHTGGTDLIFPHHENEIAQSVSATGKRFVGTWVHSEHLLVDGSKMSKSLGNLTTLRDLLRQGFSSAAIRYFLLSTHYRQKLNLTADAIPTASRSVERLNDFRRRLERVRRDARSSGSGLEEVLRPFREAMDDDLNIARGLGVLFQWVRETNRRMDEESLSRSEAAFALETLRRIDSVIGVVFSQEVDLSEEERRLVREREEARLAGDFKRADEIRGHFLKKHIRLEDTPQGTVVKPIPRGEMENSECSSRSR
ncbi:MAG: cysteine--tRNA ligase [Fidelibacterota bacterium]